MSISTNWNSCSVQIYCLFSPCPTFRFPCSSCNLPTSARKFVWKKSIFCCSRQKHLTDFQNGCIVFTSLLFGRSEKRANNFLPFWADSKQGGSVWTASWWHPFLLHPSFALAILAQSDFAVQKKKIRMPKAADLRRCWDKLTPAPKIVSVVGTISGFSNSAGAFDRKSAGFFCLYTRFILPLCRSREREKRKDLFVWLLF